MTTIYIAEARIPKTDPEEWGVFVSLDEETYLPVTRRPVKGALKDDAETITKLLEGSDGFKPMTYHRRFLLAQGASFGWVCED